MGLNVDDFYVPKESNYTIRLLSGKLMPGPTTWVGGIPFYFASRVHNLEQKSYYCTKVLQNGRWTGECVVCEHYERFHQLGQPLYFPGQNFDRALRMIKPVERYFYNVIFRGQEKIGPKVWKCGKMLHQQIVTAIVGDPTIGSAPLGDVTHPTTGRDLVVEVKQKIVGNGGQTFPIASGAFMPPSNLGTAAQVAKWAKQLHDLNQVFIPPTESNLLNELKLIFGYLGKRKSKGKRMFRTITDPFNPSW